jgi:hypothetical protein
VKAATTYLGAVIQTAPRRANIGAIRCHEPDSRSAQALPVRRLRRSIA